MFIRNVRLLQHAAWIWWELSWMGHAIVTRERDEAMQSLSKSAVPYLSSAFKGWPIPNNILVICNLIFKKYQAYNSMSYHASQVLCFLVCLSNTHLHAEVQYGDPQNTPITTKIFIQTYASGPQNETIYKKTTK